MRTTIIIIVISAMLPISCTHLLNFLLDCFLLHTVCFAYCTLYIVNCVLPIAILCYLYTSQLSLHSTQYMFYNIFYTLYSILFSSIAVMLSAESAAGKYPVESVTMQQLIINKVEVSIVQYSTSILCSDLFSFLFVFYCSSICCSFQTSFYLHLTCSICYFQADEVYGANLDRFSKYTTHG